MVGGVGFFYQEEIRAITGLLNYLVNPADMISLGAVLKSALFRLTDSDLETVIKSHEPVAALEGIDKMSDR